MKTICIKLGTAHAQVNLTDEQYNELMRLLEEEKKQSNPRCLKTLILEAANTFPKPSTSAEQTDL